MSEPRLKGRVALVTGGGRGLGRAHALVLARLGAKVLVNDFGGTVDGRPAGSSPAAEVVREIAALGGEAAADAGDVGSWEGAGRIVAHAIERFGRLDILVNNAGILRPKTLVGMSEADALDVLNVHLVGSFAATHFAAVHWRERFKARGERGGRLINTTSASGLFGIGQANYAAAKAGIVALTAVAAAELAPYGATANAVSPIAVTRMSAGIAPDNFTPDHAAELVGWLATEAASGVSGHVFAVGGGHVSVIARPEVDVAIDEPGLHDVDALDRLMPGLLARARAHPDLMGYRPGRPRSPLLPDLSLPRGDR